MSKKVFLNLGRQPITNSYLSNLKNINREYFYNLKITFNDKNNLVSLANYVKPTMMFNNSYAHRASSSITMQSHFKKLSIECKKRIKKIKCLEIGSNDGVFIKNFSKKNTIAVEPCSNLANITKKNGYKTYPVFWDQKISKKILKKYGKRNLIFSANTISHIEKLDEVFLSVKKLLDKDGMFIFEDPYILSVLKNNSYDQFYDEHAHLFSYLSVSNLLKEFNLRVFDAKILNVHGGSIRFYVCHENAKYRKSISVTKIINKELKNKINKFQTYKNFANRIKKSKIKLLKILKKIKKNNNLIVGYGATYKSATIYNFCKISDKLIDYIVDTTKNKQNKYTPGSHIRILPPKIGMNSKVKNVFLSAWNFKREIIKKEINFLKNGGSFITHVPHPRIIKFKDVKKEIS